MENLNQELYAYLISKDFSRRKLNFLIEKKREIESNSDEFQVSESQASLIKNNERHLFNFILKSEAINASN